MALAFAEGKSNTGAASPLAITALTSSIAVGELIVVYAGCDITGAALITGVTDSKGNTYTQVPSFYLSGGTNVLDCWYTVVSTGHTGTSNVISVAFNDTTANASAVAQYFTGFTGVPTLDKSKSQNNASSTTATSGATAATTQAVELVIGGFIHTGTVSSYTLGSGYTNLTQQATAQREMAMESKVTSATAAQTATATIAAARANIGGVVTFYDLNSTTTDKTQTGKSRITVTTVKTQLGKANVLNTTPQTQLGKSRITITTLHTQTGKAAIGLTTPQTQLGRANLKGTTSRTILGRASIRATADYTYGGYVSLPVDNLDLSNSYTPTQITNVSTFGNTTDVNGISANTYRVHQFAKYFASQQNLTIVWTGKAGQASSVRNVVLQIYNVNTPGWETLNTDSTTSAGASLTINGSQTTSLSNYFDGSGYAYFRVYQ